MPDSAWFMFGACQNNSNKHLVIEALSYRLALSTRQPLLYGETCVETKLKIILTKLKLGRWISLSLKPAGTTKQVPEESGLLHRVALSQKT